MKKQTYLLLSLPVSIFFILFLATNAEAQVCGSNLRIDRYQCNTKYSTTSPFNRNPYCAHELYVAGFVASCSQFGADCQTTTSWCVDVSTCTTASGNSPCTTSVNDHCDSGAERAQCAAGTRYNCRDGTVCTGCNEQRYDCWIGGTPTPTPSGGTPTPTPSPSCTVDLLPSTASTSIGSGVTLTASVAIGSGTVDQVNFISSDTGIVTVNPASDSTAVYSTQATGVSNGSTTVAADVVMGGSVRCTDSSTVDVTVPGPWWQVGDADVTSGGDIVSPIPGTCTLPVCNPVFNLQGTGGFPGVSVYDGATADFQAGSGTGTVAESPYSWLVNTSYSSSKIYDYSFFERQIPSDVTFTEIASPTYNGGDFNSGGSPARGYVWYHFDGATLGDMTISGNVNLTGSRRVVLLVDGADLYITGRINVQSPGNGYFMVVVGKDTSGLKGNIIVDPSVSHPTAPGIEGVYLAEGEFRTGAGTNRLYVRGAVASYDGIVLERDLEGNNDDTPAEYFEYAPDIIATFPQVFTSRRMRWKEIAP